MLSELKYCMEHFEECSCQTLWVLRECSFFYPIFMKDPDIEDLVRYLVEVGRERISGSSTLLPVGADLAHDVASAFSLCRL